MCPLSVFAKQPSHLIEITLLMMSHPSFQITLTKGKAEGLDVLIEESC